MVTRTDGSKTSGRGDGGGEGDRNDNKDDRRAGAGFRSLRDHERCPKDCCESLDIEEVPKSTN